VPGASPSHRARIGRFEIDDIAEQDLSFVQLIAPDDNRLESERAFAQALDHRLAAGLDALRNRDLAFARQKLDRSHLAQIHAHRIVRPIAGLGRALDLHRHAGFRLGLRRCCFLGLLLGIDDVDAHVGEHRHRVFDLL
jgi:hypothetical protein